MQESFGPRERILRKKDFNYLYRNGSRVRDRYFTLVFLTNGLAHSRLGVVVSKKVGSAVVRNRFKRRARALFRQNKERLTTHMDLVMIARKESADVSWDDLRSHYLEAVMRITTVR